MAVVTMPTLLEELQALVGSVRFRFSESMPDLAQLKAERWRNKGRGFDW